MSHPAQPPAADPARAAVKRLALRSYDLNMLATASSYDLREPDERARSTHDLEQLFFRLVRDVAPDLFIEAGAKDAGSSRRARGYCEDARIVAFEANPYTHARFQQENASAEQNVEYLHLALSDEPGIATFNVRMRADGRAHADGQGSLLKREDHTDGYEEVSVRATTLDAFFADHAYERACLWIDVEGAAEQVLGGARAVLQKAAVAIIEVEDYAFWGQKWVAADVAGCFYDSGLVAVARDFQARRLYNVIFVREELLDLELVRIALAEHRSVIAHPRPLASQAGVERLRRRALKLTREPKRFFADSGSPIVRRVGEILWR